MEWEDEKEPEDEEELEDGDDLEALRLLRLPEVLRLVGVGKSTFYRMVHEGLFPKPVGIGPRSVGWPRRVVVAWIKKRPPADQKKLQKES